MEVSIQGLGFKVIYTLEFMGCFQNCGPLWVIDYITAPNIQGYQDGTQLWKLPI